MTSYQLVNDAYHCNAWNETWVYPAAMAMDSVDQHMPNFMFFPFEKNFNPLRVLVFSRQHSWLGSFFVAVYIVAIYAGTHWMKSRKAFDLRRPLRYWNLFLALLSFIGALRVVPQLIYVISKSSMASVLCIPPIWTFGYGPAGFWTILFVYSKYIELIDTLFIILRKRELTFLHWYHHSTVLLFTWRAFLLEQPVGSIFCAMNYTVHALMYYYYYLTSSSFSPNWGILVTIAQCAQMLIGMTITIFAIRYSFKYPFLSRTTSQNKFNPFSVPGCFVDKQSLFEAMAMYSTYFYLFATFFQKRYMKPKIKS